MKTAIGEAPRPEDYGHLLSAARLVVAERERELLEIKGPCSTARCRLHYAHSGPCDIKDLHPAPTPPLDP